MAVQASDSTKSLVHSIPVDETFPITRIGPNNIAHCQVQPVVCIHVCGMLVKASKLEVVV